MLGLDRLIFPHWRARRAIQAMIAGELEPTDHRWLAKHVRSCAACRQVFEREITVVRLLEQRTLARCERAHLAAVMAGQGQTNSRSSTVSWVALAVVGTAAVLVVAPRLSERKWALDEWGVRGTSAAFALAIEAYCGEPPRPAQSTGCALDESLTLTYRLRSQATKGLDDGTLTIFGVDADGRPLYYTPNPDERHGLPVQAGNWRALPFSTDLAVNHQAGNLRIFALRAPRVLTIEEIEEVAAKLAPTPPPRVGDDPWHILAASWLPNDLCRAEHACDSAQLSFAIEKELR